MAVSGVEAGPLRMRSGCEAIVCTQMPTLMYARARSTSMNTTVLVDNSNNNRNEQHGEGGVFEEKNNPVIR
jgi:hypothetical protein